MTTWSIVDAEIDAAHVEQALDEQPGADQQRHRQRDLRGHQRRAEPRRRPRAGRLARLPLERRSPGSAACCAARGRGRTAGPCRRVTAAAKSSDPRVDAKLEHRRPLRPAAATMIRSSVHRATSRPGSAAERPRARTDSVSSCRTSCHAARADRQAHRHLGRSRRRPRQQQVGDVRAGDQQHEAGDRRAAGSAASSPPCAAALAARVELDGRPSSPGTAPSSGRSCPSAAALRRR